MSKVCLLVLCSLLLVEGIFAQNILKGKVLANSEPVEFANVVLKRTSKGAITDSLGFFQLLEVPAGSYQIQVSRIGFLTENISVLVFPLYIVI